MPHHEFSVGAIRCVVVPDKINEIPQPALIGLFPPASEIEAAIVALTEPQIFSMNCLLVETGGQLILFDTGLGTLDPTYATQTIANLREAGAAPEDIDLVVITHGHGDHFGGVVDAAGQLVFSKARYMMTRRDWNHWTGPESSPAVDRCLRPLHDRITLIEPDAIIAPDVRALSALGHTPGHIGALIESQGETLLDVVDALHHPMQAIHPAGSPRFDVDPVQSAQTRRALLARAAAESCRVMAYHFPFPGLGSIRAEGDGFVFDAAG
jgi:glyoxylase-like metal-dependent hydrolase (beta-lactamase superfamily II)